MQTIKVAIADANIILREGLKQILVINRDLVVVGEAADEMEVAEIVDRTSPDVVLLDLEIMKQRTVQLLLERKRKGVSTNVLILCSFPHGESILDAAKAGARGCVFLNGVQPATIIHAIRRIHAGDVWVDRRLSCSQTFAEIARQESGYDVDEREDDFTTMLSKRELEIISLVAHGLTNETISKKLFISKQTVKIHLNHIFHKLGVKNRTQAALLHVEHHKVGLSAA